jgi:predicted enzyme related to lactoylglutathione lyase
MPSRPKIGSVGWVDLTVDDAEGVRDFYHDVVGWVPVPVDMGGYADWAMRPPRARKPAAGVVNRRGVNAKVPPTWIVYFVVGDLAESVRRARARGAKVVDDRKEAGFCILRDPAGAVFALYQPPAPARRKKR